jgi:hypothetical protein
VVLPMVSNISLVGDVVGLLLLLLLLPLPL